MQRGTLIHFLQLALDGQMPSGWLFLATEEPNADSECAVVPVDELDDDHYGLNEELFSSGFTVQGLDDEAMRNVVASAQQIESAPPPDLLVEAFVYYWRHDACLPARGAAPPSADEIARSIDRAFYDKLGAEHGEEKCRDARCGRGRVAFSVLCRRHHFEMVKGRPCPFDD